MYKKKHAQLTIGENLLCPTLPDDILANIEHLVNMLYRNLILPSVSPPLIPSPSTPPSPSGTLRFSILTKRNFEVILI